MNKVIKIIFYLLQEELGGIFIQHYLFTVYSNFKNKIYLLLIKGACFKELSKVDPYCIKALGFEGKVFIKKLASLFLLTVAIAKAFFY